MKQYGVLVVDDSSFMRRSISLIIEKDPQFFYNRNCEKWLRCN
ncbi:hypothetical protein [Clostridium saccharobutylicum]|nr:hypothetical protein [Clostridium saccharobutylicum]MBA9010219.1 chemotaxis response regulator CheB [Clostridium saccharobutylicum]